ncbi:MAG: ABC-2 family transporter protein [Chloroflexi bacterium]|nr:ABC-2 family transporter protein [Chloroflexota bacterium]
MNIPAIVRLYLHGVLTQIKVPAQYRGDTWVAIVSILIWRGLRVGFIGIAFSFIADLGGWTVWEVVLMWANSLFAEFLVNSVAAFVSQADLYFYQGRMDYARIRPVPVMVFASVEQMRPEFLLSAIFFAIVGAVASINLGLFSSPLSIVLLGLAVASAALLWFGIMLFMSSGAAWLSRARVLKFGVWSFDEHAKYPLDILPFPLQVGLTVIPYAFTSYYPISLALRPETHIWPGILSLPVGLAVAAISLFMYGKASSHYDSLGSADPT